MCAVGVRIGDRRDGCADCGRHGPCSLEQATPFSALSKHHRVIDPPTMDVVQPMPRAIGIDLGTTNSVVAVFDVGQPTVIPTVDGERIVPSVVGFKPNGERVIGHQAKRQLVVYPERTVYSAKRFIGRRFAEIGVGAASMPYDVHEGEDGGVRFSIADCEVSPEECAACILSTLAQHASYWLEDEVVQAVITVPAYFNDAQRQATKLAGEIAGLEVIRIINEPTAAALAYDLVDGASQNVLVFDFGGGTLDVSVLEAGEGMCEVLATAGDTELGGDDFDRLIVDWIADDVLQAQGVDVRSDARTLSRVLEAAERAKCELSSAGEASIELPFVFAGGSKPFHISKTISRVDFEERAFSLLQRAGAVVRRALADSGLPAQKLDQVLLVGGSSRIPAVRQLVASLTGGKQGNIQIRPDEAVALGAAVQAAILTGAMDDMVLLDVTPLSLGVAVDGDKFHCVIPRNTTVPTADTQTFSTAGHFQRGVDIVVLQGEQGQASLNRELGRFGLDGLKAAVQGEPQIDVTFSIDENGILSVSAREVGTGRAQSIAIRGATTISRNEIDELTRRNKEMLRCQQRARESAEAFEQAQAVLAEVETQLEQLSRKSLWGSSKAERLIDKLRLAIEADNDPAKVLKLSRQLRSMLD
ncbi:MAG: molecular chaperone DnaK [Bdellovibrionales bacterium]|nr:molecular chaperone DnaK [Bdellovibrionales bacterium]